jgi:hypothetical protein
MENLIANPQNLTYFGLVGRETDNRRENGSLQAKSKTIVFISDPCPTKQLLRNAFRWRDYIDQFSFDFTDSRRNLSEFTQNVPKFVIKGRNFL